MKAGESHAILVIEDDPGQSEALSRILQARGYRVRLARDGDEGVRLAEAERPDLILTDLHMPGVDGMELCRRLREGLRTRQIPIMVLTGYEGTPGEAPVLDGGADDYLDKPYSADILLSRVKSLLRRRDQLLTANPLTALPGAPALEREILERLLEAVPFACLYLDLDNFKAYNDKYGYFRGDEAIQLLARTTVAALEKHAARSPRPWLLSHIGGDDFVAVCLPQEAVRVAESVARGFDAQAATLYAPSERRLGGIQTVDRRGQPQFYPIMTATIAVTSTEGRIFRHYGQVAAVCAELKRFAKSQPDRKGSFWLLDRRKGAR